MNPRVTYIHSFSALPDVFDRLTADHLPHAQTAHIVDAKFYEAELDRGFLTPEEEDLLVAYAQLAEARGSDAVVVTCSFLGTSVDKLRDRIDIPWLRVDEAMARKALELGSSVGVVATAESSLASTQGLLDRLIRERGSQHRIVARLCEGAFEALVAGDQTSHDASVRRTLTSLAPEVDVIVLSQASMAPVAQAMGGELQKPVLTSPPLCMEQLASML